MTALSRHPNLNCFCGRWSWRIRSKIDSPCVLSTLYIAGGGSFVQGEGKIKGHVSDSVLRRAQSFIAVVLKHAFFVFAVSHSSLLMLWGAAAIHAIRKILLFRHDMPTPLSAGNLSDLNREGSSFASKLKGLCEFNAINMLAQQIKKSKLPPRAIEVLYVLVSPPKERLWIVFTLFSSQCEEEICLTMTEGSKRSLANTLSTEMYL